MFSTKEQLIRRTGKNGINRYAFLELLVGEYNTTKSRDAKEQVIANLANFAYDPVNYDYLRQLGALDIFLNNLSEQNHRIVCYSIKGICNLCIDPINKIYLLRKNSVQLISPLLNSEDWEVVLSALTTLMYLINAESKNEITCPQVVQKVQELKSNADGRIRNLVTIFLNDYCKIDEDDKVLQDNASVDQIIVKENHADQQKNDSIDEQVANNTDSAH